MKTTRSWPTRKDQSRQRTPQIGSSGKGEGRELLGEWMKLTSVRSQDQRRMLQATSHNFQTNDWIHRITKGKESDKYDLCEALWLAEGRFKTEKDLPEQTLGHIPSPAHMTNPISSPHRCSPPMLESDPWRTGPVGVIRMEILVHLRREVPPDDLEWQTIRHWGSTVSKSYTGHDMECWVMLCTWTPRDRDEVQIFEEEDCFFCLLLRDKVRTK